MRLDEFDYELPRELIADFPLQERSASRLLCLKAHTKTLEHRYFYQLADLLLPNDLLVFNDSRVIPARLFGRKQTGGKVEVLVERVLPDNQALVHIKASKSPANHCQIILDNHYIMEIKARQGDLFHVTFLTQKSIFTLLEEIGHIPLPLYIQREDEALDKERYQTVYNRTKGSVAAPTAGLHFDSPLLEALQAKGVDSAYVTLHVGAGTFQPVRVDNIEDHNMHQEMIFVNQTVVDKVQSTKRRGGRVIAVGTTSVRCLEAASATGEIKPFQGETDIFIYPGYEFQCIDALITNFHLPKSSLIMLVAAFAGLTPTHFAYQAAVQQQYRFFSYGDAMFITGKDHEV